MFDFYKISSRLYVVRKNGELISEVPLTKRELVNFLISMPLTELELMHIERFYSDAS